MSPARKTAPPAPPAAGAATADQVAAIAAGAGRGALSWVLRDAADTQYWLSSAKRDRAATPEGRSQIAADLTRTRPNVAPFSWTEEVPRVVVAPDVAGAVAGAVAGDVAPVES